VDLRTGGARALVAEGSFSFESVRRGYDRAQVDAFVSRLVAGAAPDEVPAFDVVRRGYDRAQVDAVIAELRAR